MGVVIVHDAAFPISSAVCMHVCVWICYVIPVPHRMMFCLCQNTI